MNATGADSDAALQRLHEQGGELGAVVLAGGLSRRMGGIDKGLMTVAGRPMVVHVLEAIRPAVDVIIVNANRHADAYSALGVDVHPDRRAGHLGPLAGLSTALSVLETSHVFMCPCDSPFIDAVLIDRLLSSALQGDHDVAVAADDERLQPVFCLVNRRVEASLNAYLDSGERKIDRWFETLNQVAVPCADLQACFRNINTEAERLAAEQALEPSA